VPFNLPTNLTYLPCDLLTFWPIGVLTYLSSYLFGEKGEEEMKWTPDFLLTYSPFDLLAL
jgi:hypothetical protein